MLDLLNKVKAVFTTKVADTSPTGKVDKTDVAKLIKTGALVGIAAAVSYFVTNVDPVALGVYQPLIIMVLTVGLDYVNKLIKSNTNDEQKGN